MEAVSWRGLLFGDPLPHPPEDRAQLAGGDGAITVHIEHAKCLPQVHVGNMRPVGGKLGASWGPVGGQVGVGFVQHIGGTQ